MTSPEKKVEEMAEQLFKKIQQIDIDVEEGLEHSFARSLLKRTLKEALTTALEEQREEIVGMVEARRHICKDPTGFCDSPEINTTIDNILSDITARIKEDYK